MLRQVRSHAHGLRFYEVLANSPLTIVYQCLGNVKAGQLEDTLKAEAIDTKNGVTAVPVSFRIKNSLAAALGRPDVAAYLQATNVLVGWDVAESPGSKALFKQARAVKADERLSHLVADAASTSQTNSPKQPPQNTLSSIIKASLRLAEKYPLAPLAGFFHGQRINVSDLRRWSELDDATVYGRLLAQLDAPSHGLLQSLNVGDAGISALLDSQNGSLVSSLEARSASAGGGATPVSP